MVTNNNNGNGLGTLTERVRAVERDVGRIQVTAGEAHARIDQQNAGNWKALSGGLTIVLSVVTIAGWLILSPIQSNADRQDRNIQRLMAESNEQGKTIATLVANHNALSDVVDDRIKAFRDLMRRVEDHKVDDKTYAKDSLVFAKRIDELDRKIDGILPPRDAFSDILRRLWQIEQRGAK